MRCTERIASDRMKDIHQIRISGLKAGTQYFYRALSSSGEGATVESETRTFETAPNADEPIAFAVISDTQGNPPVASKMAGFAWSQRPDFLLHPGDLTETGSRKDHWTHEFFPSMEELISRVPIFPVLGNHEQNAHWYYDYMALPEPEYYYTFTYGPAQFFMLDGNKRVGPDSEQYLWLEKELAASTAQWKFVCHHQPVYSSDENDYGNLWKKNTSSRGDMNVRQLATLYDKYGIDIVFNGHIHSYERTWPLREGRATSPGNGTVYMVTGGGGGGLETPGPIRPFFQNTVKRGHHFCYVAVNGKTLELKAYDLEGRLFDTLSIQKR
ncbi:MAG: metallophosphoesterase family protein [Planctomycetes bacterium]|nr:metallophosphoesterase family protein [Planctomycetota bacterium]